MQQIDNQRVRNKKGVTIIRNTLIDSYLVGVAGFEPTTSWSQTRRDTGLRYTPNI